MDVIARRTPSPPTGLDPKPSYDSGKTVHARCAPPRQLAIATPLLLLTLLLNPIGIAQTLPNPPHRSPPAAAPQTQTQTQAKLLSDARQLMLRGQSDDAIAALEQGIERWPDFAEAYNNLAVMYADRGDLERAKVILEQGIHSNTAFAMLFRNLGRIYESLALSAYSKALAQDPDPSAQHPQLTALELLPNRSDQPTDTQPAGPTPTPPITASTVPEPPIDTDTVDTVTTDVIDVADAETTSPPIAAVSRPAADAVDTTQNQADALTQAALAWATAWSRQDMVAYLRAYHPEFKPASGASRQRWMATRSRRIERPEWIEVTLNELSVTPLSSRRQAVDFRQVYRNERFTSVIRKRLVMEWGPDGWQIISEIVTDKNAE